MAFDRSVAFDLTVVKQTLKQICKDYQNHVTQESANFLKKVGNLISGTLHYMDSNETRRLNKEFIKRIDNLQTAQDLVELAIYAGKEGYRVQAKTLFNYSTYTETCYLIQHYILRLPELADYEKKLNAGIAVAKEIHELPGKIKEKLEEIKQKLNAKNIEIKKRMDNSEKVDMSICHEYMRERYYLGDHYLENPIDIKTIFPTNMFRWSRPDYCKVEINPNYPLVMQKNYAEIQIKKFRPDLEDKILHEYKNVALAVAPENNVDMKASGDSNLATPTARDEKSVLPKPLVTPPNASEDIKPTPSLPSSSAAVLAALNTGPTDHKETPAPTPASPPSAPPKGVVVRSGKKKKQKHAEPEPAEEAPSPSTPPSPL